MTKSFDSIDRNTAVVRARELRRKPSLPEGLLWQVLRTRPKGLKFRRQHPLGWYVVDFYCASAKLVIEVDGERPAHDADRDQWLRRQGLRVIRFEAVDVMGDLEAVVTAITFACRS